MQIKYEILFFLVDSSRLDWGNDLCLKLLNAPPKSGKVLELPKEWDYDKQSFNMTLPFFTCFLMEWKGPSKSLRHWQEMPGSLILKFYYSTFWKIKYGIIIDFFLFFLIRCHWLLMKKIYSFNKILRLIKIYQKINSRTV